jgi:hypothetical protein
MVTDKADDKAAVERVYEMLRHRLKEAVRRQRKNAEALRLSDEDLQEKQAAFEAFKPTAAAMGIPAKKRGKAREGDEAELVPDAPLFAGKKMVISEGIECVLAAAKEPMGVKQIYEAIIALGDRLSHPPKGSDTVSTILSGAAKQCGWEKVGQGKATKWRKAR